jgi:hypothetical protein
VGPTLTPAAASTTVYADMTALIAATGMSNGDQAFVTGNNNLYIYSGSGWYKVATVQNDAPSAITGVNGTYQLAIDGTATTITAVSTDPEGFPLTWSYSASGLGSIATVSQVDNVFTITPSTTIADAGTFSLTINATDGVNGAVSTTTNLTLEFIVIVTNSKYTTLLATAVDTSDNNNITDSSSNNHSITVGGDTYAGTFSPYHSGGYSTYFDGTGDMLKYENNDYNWGTGNFTIEAWAYLEESGSTRIIFSQRDENGPMIRVNDTGLVRYFRGNGSNQRTSSVQFPIGQWNHVALVRSGTGANQTKVYLNGAEILSFQETTNFSASTARIRIGSYQSAGSEVWKGYITDVRAVKSAVYTAEFTNSLPTNRLEVIANTSLLTCHLPYLADGSTFNSPVIISGNPSTKPFSPYDYNEYSAADNGGSVYFDGTGDYIEHQGTFTLPAGTNANWTIECWVNLDQVNLNQGILRVSSTAAAGNNDDIYFSEQSGYINVACKAGGINSATSNYTMSANIWHHIAMVKNNGTVYLYNNGVYCGSISDSNDYSGSYYIYGGLYYSTSYCFAGYLTDFRISNAAVYTSGTSNFTPPTAPLSSSGAALHIKGTDASIIDKSQGSNLKLFGNTTGSTTQAKFGGSKSMYFDGTGDYISIPADDSIFSKDYTIEFWMYPTQDTNLLMPFSKGVGLQFYHQSGNIAAALSWNNSSYSYNGNFGSITTNAWSHISLVRDSSASTYKFYINGTLEDTLSSASNIDTGSSDWIIGAFLTSGNYAFEGYIQDVRVTEGLTRYTTNFTPPTAPLKG